MQALPSQDCTLTPQVDASIVIAGAGPAGLASACLLAQRGYRNITLLEKRASATQVQPNRSYLYSIDGRGSKLLDLIGVMDDIRKAGVLTTDIDLTSVDAQGEWRRQVMQMKDRTKQTCWLSRPAFLTVLANRLHTACASGAVSVVYGVTIDEVEYADAKLHDGHVNVSPSSQNAIVVHATDSKGAKTIYPADLLIGCDGINSAVRRSLEKKSELAKMIQLNSPSAGLHYRIIQLPPNPPVITKEGVQHLENHLFAVLIGAQNGDDRSLRLGLLPMKDPESPRTANIITKPNHKVWEAKSGHEFKAFLQESFPQLNIAELMTDHQIEAWASTPPGKFPAPQSCKKFTHVVPINTVDGAPLAKSTTPAAGAVVLMGDALHAFPPDLGQGVNSALEDVVVFDQALQSAGGTFAEAAQHFQELREQDAAALVELMSFSFPYQYNQDRLGRSLWTVNFLLRTVLNKILPAIFSPHSFLMVQERNMPYAEVLKRAHSTTRSIWIAAVALLASVALVAARMVWGA